jgi:hypothetical protein
VPCYSEFQGAAAFPRGDFSPSPLEVSKQPVFCCKVSSVLSPEENCVSQLSVTVTKYLR